MKRAYTANTFRMYKEAIVINRHRFHSDMETAWELRPDTDETPGSHAHHNRFAKPMPQAQNLKKAEKLSADSKNRENGS